MVAQPGHYRTGNQALVREINLSTILNRLRENAPISRSALAEMTGLNKTTVSSLVQELIDQQFVHEVGLDSVGTGRPAMLLELNPAAGCIISSEIGVDFISVICSNFASQVIWQHKESTRSDAGLQATLEHTLTLLHRAADAACNSYDSLLGLAIGVPGLVDRQNGTLLFAPNLNWTDVPLGDILREEFELPIFIDNEANLAALGEYYFGAAKYFSEVLYVSAGAGLGGGIVHDGQLINGATGFAGEFGHMTMDEEGEFCSCGNRGCWETQVNQAALFRNIRQAIMSDRGAARRSTMLSGDLDQLTVPLVVKAARAGDPIALAALDKVGHHLGVGIASLVNALNP
ncbi:MAG: ROK family transcriptional regulator, partial [Anaerolineae bacterium]|nr:ROK family transcriptional regulator [Anaerolineae bacterium]